MIYLNSIEKEQAKLASVLEEFNAVRKQRTEKLNIHEALIKAKEEIEVKGAKLRKMELVLERT